MERVVFLVESSDEHIPCLLNPESLLLQRRAGVGVRSLHGGLVTGSDLMDDPLLFTGGGITELTVNLLFDVNVSGRPVEHGDVRQLTEPLWRLAENKALDGGRRRPAFVRLIWGKAFNFPGVITEVAERLERFSADGTPQRSFLRLRMRRVAEDADESTGGKLVPPQLPEDLSDSPLSGFGEGALAHAVSGTMAADSDGAGETERLDQLAYEYYGDPAQWRLLAWFNDIDDPLRLSVGSILQVPDQNEVPK